MRRRLALAEWLALCLAATLFLWMYLSSDGLVATMATEAARTGLAPDDRERAADFAARWRHGLVGWPLFAPGFFLSAIAVAWCEGRHSLRVIVGLGGSALVAGFATAWLLAPLGTEYVATALRERTGVDVSGPYARGGVGTLAGVATIVVWSVTVLTVRRCLRHGHWRLLALPSLAYASLALIRGTVQLGDLGMTWAERVVQCDVVALASVTAAVVVTAILVHGAWQDGRVIGAAAARTATGEPGEGLRS